MNVSDKIILISTYKNRDFVMYGNIYDFNQKYIQLFNQD